MIACHSASVLQVYDFPQSFLQHTPPSCLLALLIKCLSTVVGQLSLPFCFPFHITGNFCFSAFKISMLGSLVSRPPLLYSVISSGNSQMLCREPYRPERQRAT